MPWLIELLLLLLLLFIIFLILVNTITEFFMELFPGYHLGNYNGEREFCTTIFDGQVELLGLTKQKVILYSSRDFKCKSNEFRV